MQNPRPNRANTNAQKFCDFSYPEQFAYIICCHAVADSRTQRWVVRCAVGWVFAWKGEYFARLEVQAQSSFTNTSLDECLPSYGIALEGVLPAAAFLFELL
jgi:hypothetical protein